MCDRAFNENNANSLLNCFLKIANCNLSETGRNKVELVLNILVYSDIIRHIQELSRDIIQIHSESCVILLYSESLHIQNPGIFRSLIYLEPCHIQNQSHIQNPGIFRTSNIFRTLSNHNCDRVFYKNNANSFLHYLQICQTATLPMPVAIWSN